MKHLTPELLDALLCGELSARDSATLRAHLDADCPICAAVLQEPAPDEAPDTAPPSLETLARLLAAQDAPPEPMPAHLRDAAWMALVPDLPGRSASERILSLVFDDEDSTPLSDPIPEPDPASTPPPLRVVPTPPVAESPFPFRPPTPTAPVASPSRSRWWATGAITLLAAAVALIVILPRLPDSSEPAPPTQPPAQTEKGLRAPPTPPEAPPPAPPSRALALSVVRGRLVDGQFQLGGALSDGQAVTPDTTLLFELDADHRGARYLFAVDGDDTIIPLYPTPQGHAGVAREGPRPVTWNRQWVTLDLSDVKPPVRLVGAIAERPVPLQPDIIDAWRKADTGLPSTELPINFDVISLDIAP